MDGAAVVLSNTTKLVDTAQATVGKDKCSSLQAPLAYTPKPKA